MHRLFNNCMLGVFSGYILSQGDLIYEAQKSINYVEYTLA